MLKLRGLSAVGGVEYLAADTLDFGDFLAINKLILEHAGYRVLTADSPHAAWELLNAAPETELPALIITDLMMSSHLDAGFSLARQVKADPRLAGTRIIIATAVALTAGMSFRPTCPADLEAMGADAYLDKPISPKTLLANVAKLLPKET